ncbi:unnamed protein product [Sordaria macrospora k-hell]|uniref:WGS project CABT00000000 data, contig 2.10 n=1 Tax=Sordaria macrospora (strain ATCC MYA-333 / DSM 997 / K(L3346) / K-hell) TaxID=771870 RepID=F7VWH7_SORMK|nr:uncharacterized protein SMAC_03301 [Sordaria macrospora k-hell]CCC09745.1 unnamed protein product [Sordaria macrospora k-hell]
MILPTSPLLCVSTDRSFSPPCTAFIDSSTCSNLTMAGGVKKPVNIFKLKNLGEPKEVFNWRLWFAVFSFGLLGAARGVDEGLINGAFKSKNFQDSISYDSYSKVEQANIKANVVYGAEIGSVGGALFAFLICDRIGRIWATRQLCVLWILGIAIFMGSNGNLGAVYAGRFVAGLGVGQTPVVGPVYIAEIAPASIRGLCTCIFTGFVYLGIVLAYFTNYGCQLHLGETPARWQVPTSLHIIFAGLIFLLTFLQYESPRYLVKTGKNDRALHVMSRLRHLPADHAYVQREINAITLSHHEEMEATKGAGWLGVVREAFTVRSNLYRVGLTVGAQVLSQWSGAGSITIYAPDLFELLGITGTEESLLVTAVFGIIKLVAAILCALFLVDFIGRKRSLLLGITCQAVAMLYVAGFLSAVPQLGNEEGYVLSPSSGKLRASRGAIVMIYLIWERSGGAGYVVTLEMGGISSQGAFWFFAAVTILGGVWVWFAVPETAGRSLESMDRLFSLPWWKIGRYGNREAAVLDEAERVGVSEKEGEMMSRSGSHAEEKGMGCGDGAERRV